MNETVLHQWIDNGPKIAVKTEKNSRSLTWEISISNCTSPDQAIDLLRETRVKLLLLEKEYIEGVNQ